MSRLFSGALFAAAALCFVAWSSGAEKNAATRPSATSQPAQTRPATTQPSNQVVITTSQGKITVELTPDKTPITVKNFLRYVDEKHYDDTIFHRVVSGFMIQGGGYAPDAPHVRAEKKTHPPIKNESKNGLSNQRGTIAMARLPDPDSATAQFFINLDDNSRLDMYGGGYTAFGKVVKGMDVVDKIAAVRTRPGPLTPRESAQPVEPVIIESIRRTSTD